MLPMVITNQRGKLKEKLGGNEDRERTGRAKPLRDLLSSE